MPKMLILRGNSGPNYPDESGKPHNYDRGALHELAAVEYASRKGYTLLDRRLYLPDEWCDAAHRERWQRCGIPEETRFTTKQTLALEMLPIHTPFFQPAWTASVESASMA